MRGTVFCTAQVPSISLDEDMLCVTGFSHKDEDVIVLNKEGVFIERR